MGGLVCSWGFFCLVHTRYTRYFIAFWCMCFVICYTKYDIQCHQLCLILIVKCGVVSPTLFVILVTFLGDYNVAFIITYWVISHPNFNNPWQYFITSWWQEKVGLWQGMNSSVIHDNICSLIHKGIATVPPNGHANGGWPGRVPVQPPPPSL